jgi:hypothetical protein
VGDVRLGEARVTGEAADNVVPGLARGDRDQLQVVVQVDRLRLRALTRRHKGVRPQGGMNGGMHNQHVAGT